MFLQTWWSSLSGAKKILLGTMVTNDTSLALVWSYLSAKANGMITRRLKRILRSQTSTGGDFLNLVLFESHIPSKVIQNVSKVVFLQMWWSNLSGTKKIFVGYHGHVWHVVDFSRIISIRKSKRHDHTTSETDPTVANVSWRWFFESGTIWIRNFNFKLNLYGYSPKVAISSKYYANFVSQ